MLVSIVGREGEMTRKGLDLLDRRFGRLIVISKTDKRSGDSVMWLCQCDCGNTKEINGSSLVQGDTKSCGCLRKEAKFNNLKDRRFGSLVVLEEVKERRRNKIVWRCLCDCGNYVNIVSGSLVTGLTKSCGCYKLQRTSESKRRDITGIRFGRLVALESTDERFNSGMVWKCRCDCGNTHFVALCVLTSGHAQSCGCLLCKGSVYLYAFRSMLTGLIKIGISGNVLTRREQLEIELCDNLELLGYSVSSKGQETQAHRLLKLYRAVHPNQPKGKEWFYPTDEVYDVVNRIKSQTETP